MSRMLSFVVSAMLFCLCVTANSSVTAQQYNDSDRGSWVGERDQSWYQQPKTYQSDTRAIIQHKAQVRAAQRNARLASLNWYGMSNSRPTAAPTPFMTLYSPVWQVPGGRPFAWFASNQPTTYVIYER